MNEDVSSPHNPSDRPIVPEAAGTPVHRPGEWQGPTYYGRSQLKAAPFENLAVGSYIFLAGLAGAASLLSGLLDVSHGGREAVRPTVRRGRYLALLAPLAASLLVYDLHTPKRFYNMLRIAKRTSPMSIGTWILMAFSTFAGTSAVAQFLGDRLPRLDWLRRVARVAHVPAGLVGIGLSTYTASLLSSTSTPFWAAAPRLLAARFGASSIAAGAAVLSLGEHSWRRRRQLDLITLVALSAELAATTASHSVYQQKSVSEALESSAGRVGRFGATDIGTVLPLGLHAISLIFSRRQGVVSRIASCTALAGSLAMRISIMAAGDESAERPEISFRFSQP